MGEQQPTKDEPLGDILEQSIKALRSLILAVDHGRLVTDKRLLAIENRLVGIEKQMVAMHERMDVLIALETSKIPPVAAILPEDKNA